MDAPSAPTPPRSLRTSRGQIVKLFAAVATLVALALGTASLAEFERRPLTLGGVELPREGDPEPFVRELAAQWHETEVTVDAGSRILRATRTELGGDLDVDATVDEVRLARGHGPIWSRVWAFATRADDELRWERTLHQAETQAFAEELRRRASVDATPVHHDGTGGRPGTAVDLIGSVHALSGALRTEAVFVRLPVRRIEAPSRTIADRSQARFGEVVSAHETRYAHFGELQGRAQNIEVATRFLDGAVIEPHGELSFNEIVGERTVERGFATAIELTRGGRRTEGIGGGICQVAATLHAAAFFAGFEIPEHHPHTRNSSYIPAGLDSAVSWPNKDIRILNPHPFHIRVRASAYRGTLRVELMGAERAPRVEWNTRIVHRIPRETEREIDPNLPLGAEEELDSGEDGSVMERTRTVYWSDGPVMETETLRYPVVHRLVRSGPQTVRETSSAPVQP